MFKQHIGNTQINLPDFDRIPVPKTKAALQKAEDLRRALAQARLDQEAATAARFASYGADQERLGRLFAADPAAADVIPTEIQDATANAEKAALSRTGGLEAACVTAVAELRAAIEEEREVWKKIAVANASKGLTKLTTATRMAEAARQELLDSIGILGMFAGYSGASIAVAQSAGGHTFDINPGIEHLRDAIVEASRELGELK